MCVCVISQKGVTYRRLSLHACMYIYVCVCTCVCVQISHLGHSSQTSNMRGYFFNWDIIIYHEIPLMKSTIVQVVCLSLRPNSSIFLFSKKPHVPQGPLCSPFIPVSSCHDTVALFRGLMWVGHMWRNHLSLSFFHLCFPVLPCALAHASMRFPMGLGHNTALWRLGSSFDHFESHCWDICMLMFLTRLGADWLGPVVILCLTFQKLKVIVTRLLFQQCVKIAFQILTSV